MKNNQECNRDCSRCRYLSARTDDKSYPWAYECLKFEDSVFREDFKNTKVFH